ncbi:LTA synthase family protein [Lewinella sp. IMCC34191]|uniref:LTA synthase family protein n=1 Tax=Lewinella sp. IMCC34191 TaxID=2259172 RepID=UPI001300BA1E|nr:alkaline phosphatase family protein [Lewinella sp. IMCC34191]
MTQRITYSGPDIGEVFLAWKAIDLHADSMLRAHPGTKEVGSLLGTPMIPSDSGFTAKLNVPAGEDIYYCFWVTRAVDGQFRDYWDTASGATITVGETDHIYVAATPEAANGTDLAEESAWGAWVLVGLLIAYALARILLPRYSEDRAGRSIDLVFGTALGAVAIHLLARAAIFEMPVANLFRRGAGKLLAAGLEDICLIAGIVAAAYLLLWVTPRRAASRVVAITIGVLTLISAIALVNVDAVEYLGSPFTYQWLYYSDFLLSSDAWSALGEQASTESLVNIVSLTLCVPLLGYLFTIFAGWLPLPGARWLLPAICSVVILAALVSATIVDWSILPGERRNAIIAFLQSAVSADATPTLGGLAVPAGQLPFREGAAARPEKFVSLDSTPIRNVVLIVLESAGAVYLDGPEAFPTLRQRLQKYHPNGLYFENIYAHAPSTNATMVSLMTGMYPKLSYESVTREFTDYPFASLPGELSRLGYRTSFFTSGDLSWQRGMEFLQHRQFDVVEDYRLIACDQTYTLQSEDYRENAAIDDLCLADRFAEWTGTSEEPFASVIWTVQSHYPYYFSGPETEYATQDLYQSRYLNALEHGVEMVDQVIAGLKATGRDSNTLVVIAGDHGEAFGQHGHHGHGNTLYEEDIRVPLYLINPVLFSGGRNAGLGGVKDIPATILGLLGVETDISGQSRNLLADHGEEAFFFSPWTQLYFGYRRGPMKFIFNESKQSVEVYNLADDPQEKHDIVHTVPASVIAEARTRVAAWVQHQSNYYDSLE